MAESTTSATIMSAAKRPASSSPPPAPEAKRLHRDDAGDGTESDHDDDQGDMGTSGLGDALATSRSASSSPLSSLSSSDDTADGGDEETSDEPGDLSTSSEEERSGRCSPNPNGIERLPRLGTARLTPNCYIDVLDEPEPDIHYKICMAFVGADFIDVLEERYGCRFEIYFQKPSWWDRTVAVPPYDVLSWVETVDGEHDEGPPPTSPSSLATASPPSDPAAVPASGQARLAGDGIPVAPGSPSPASSASRLASAMPPPAPISAFLEFLWKDRSRYNQALFTCDLMTARADPINIRLHVRSRTFVGVPLETCVYFERPDHDEHAIVDDNGNRMLMGYMRFMCLEFPSVTAFGKRVVEGKTYETTQLSAAERERIIQQHGLRLARERSEQDAESDSDEGEASDSDEGEASDSDEGEASDASAGS